MTGNWAILGVVLLVSTVAGCAGQGEDGAEGPSALPSVTRLVTRTPVQPSVTRSEGEPSIAAPSRSGPPPRTTRAPEPSDAEPPRTKPAESEPAQPSPTSAATTLTSTRSSSPSSSQPEAAPAADEDAAVPVWVWWVLGPLVATAVLTGVLLLRRRRERTEWSAGLTDALGEATWLSHDLIPSLQGQAAAGRSGVWAIGRTRVLRLEHALAALVEQAPAVDLARSCGALSSVVEALRTVFDQSEAAGDVGGAATTMALRQARHDLDEAIVALQAARAGGASH